MPHGVGMNDHGIQFNRISAKKTREWMYFVLYDTISTLYGFILFQRKVFRLNFELFTPFVQRRHDASLAVRG
jgi:hypothetical protein